MGQHHSIDFDDREMALLDQCLEFAHANIGELEEITDENIEVEIADLLNKLRQAY